ncbi:hypothetical protein RHSIM_RhsimUnG0116900 [Rhododendron simsii]|uniref:J domain-containing protein n=1 Tax=Rhododendron simsii TaxID=118357 RepID=A0A834L4D6_RHOSS|nr:hypothetical protein RHSIM_RhsimUnG0116900 [Rhododendron simsii]
MATPLIAGIAVAAAAYAGRYSIQAWQAFKARPPRLRKFYEGGFQPTMTKREAALILGVRKGLLFWLRSVVIFSSLDLLGIAQYMHLKRLDCGMNLYYLRFQVAYGTYVHLESTPADKIKEAHRRVMVANHPDAGGSHYLASKINEAKDMILGKTKGSGSAF